MFKLEVKEDICTGCGNCVVACPINALKAAEVSGGKGGGKELKIEDGISHVISDACNGCGVCIKSCAQKAILLHAPEHSPASRELMISEINKKGEEAAVVEDAVEEVMFEIDPKRRAFLESVLSSMKNIRVRYLIETGKAEDARKTILEKLK
ncbi:MAG: 4Fe-4S dicluster domain-containing protein [Methanobacteriota archaeon]